MTKKTALNLLLGFTLLAAAPAGAVDWGGADLEPANNEVLSGTYTHVGEFIVGGGTTVFVNSGAGLYVYADTITINGKLTADGGGYSGGINGAKGSPTGDPGGDGFGPGKGYGGDTGKGGGGGGHANANSYPRSGGNGEGFAGIYGWGGSVYGSTYSVSIPFSADDIHMGSGGGGGGGGDLNTVSGAGGSGGGVIYLEADYMTIAGTVTANGSDGGAGLDTWDDVNSPGGGGGGSGGGILIKAARNLSLSNTLISADGGTGGAAINASNSTPFYAGGGGAGGRIKMIYASGNFSNITVSTSAGKGGEKGIALGNYAAYGSSGTVSYGLLPSSPTGFAYQGVFKSSISYSWDLKSSGWGGPLSLAPVLASYNFRLYESTTARPLSGFFMNVSVSSNITTAYETALVPDTLYRRTLTAYTDYGDSIPSTELSTYTSAASPAASQTAAFSNLSPGAITFSWSSGTASEGFNPGYTAYEVSRAENGDFSGAVSTTTGLVALSSSSSGLAINATYYFRARALGLDGAHTSFTSFLSTSTLAVAPADPAFTGVFLDSFTFAWSSGSAGTGFNPSWTLYEAQISTDGFYTLSGSSVTAAREASFTNLSLGTFYSTRVLSLNNNGVPSAFSAAVSTAPGNFTDLEATGQPEPPQPTSRFSYTGQATFAWYPPSGAAAVYRYWLEIGTTPGASDFLFHHSVPAATLSYSTDTLDSGKTYYARVRAESLAGVLGEFSDAGDGVTVWISGTETPVSKPYNWPNPFNPSEGATNIGFHLEAAADVTLKIFTLQGRLVHEKKANEASGGNKVWQWNGRNDRGTMVEPGGYVALITKRYSGKTSSQRFKIAVLY